MNDDISSLIFAVIHGAIVFLGLYIATHCPDEWGDFFDWSKWR